MKQDFGLYQTTYFESTGECTDVSVSAADCKAAKWLKKLSTENVPMVVYELMKIKVECKEDLMKLSG